MNTHSHAIRPETRIAASPTIIRTCEERDVAAVAAIYGHHVLHSPATFELTAPSRDEMSRRRRRIIDGGYIYRVAERDGEILGYAYVSAYRSRPAYRNTVENSVYVRPGLERQGIGRLLMDDLLAACERAGFRQMIAIIGDSANHASIGLHAALGFRMVGTFQSVGFKFGRWLDSVLMQRDLGAGSTTHPP